MVAAGSREEHERFRQLLVNLAAERAVARREVADAATHAGVRKVILVEGASDRAALEAVASHADIDLPRQAVVIVPMGGATSLGRFLELLDPDRGPMVGGLCDAGEAAFTVRRLVAAGRAASDDPLRLAEVGFQVCDADLEEELIRALGPAEVERVIDEEGDLAAFRTFQRQPYQRERPVERQLRRFVGTMGGRKERYARALAERLDRATVPTPLAAVLAPARA